MEELRELKEELPVILVVLGVAGIAAYAYAQLTPLCYKVVGWAINTGFGDIPSYASPVYERDWTVWLVWALIGAVLLGFGVHRLRRSGRAGNGAAA
jgi:hypothetical protein